MTSTASNPKYMTPPNTPQAQIRAWKTQAQRIRELVAHREAEATLNDATRRWTAARDSNTTDPLFAPLFRRLRDAETERAEALHEYNIAKAACERAKQGSDNRYRPSWAPYIAAVGEMKHLRSAERIEKHFREVVLPTIPDAPDDLGDEGPTYSEAVQRLSQAKMNEAAAKDALRTARRNVDAELAQAKSMFSYRNHRMKQSSLESAETLFAQHGHPDTWVQGHPLYNIQYANV